MILILLEAENLIKYKNDALKSYQKNFVFSNRKLFQNRS
jgi:hypothetical protein